MGKVHCTRSTNEPEDCPMGRDQHNCVIATYSSFGLIDGEHQRKGV